MPARGSAERVFAYGVTAGLIGDAVFGDPRRGHPVAAFGRGAGALERVLWRDHRGWGALHALLCAGGAVGATALAARGLRDRGAASFALTAAATWAVLGGTSLGREARAVGGALAAGDVELARERLPRLCGRDAAHTVAFGEVDGNLELPYEDGGIAWSPHLVFPGLRRGETLESRIELAPRAAILAADGTALAEGEADAREHPLGSSAIDVTGEIGSPEEEELEALERQGFSAETPVGISGLEQAFNARLAGKPGGSLLAVAAVGGTARILAESQPRPGAPVKTTIDTGLQEAAVTALGGRSGGIAVLDTRNGDVRAMAGQAISAPQPPGSTFKLVTTTAALQKEVVSLDDTFEITDGVNVGGRYIYNANGEYCGGSFPEAFAESCNAVFAPLGPEIGNDDFVDTAERFGFNSPPTLYGQPYVEAVDPPEASIPTEIGDELDLGVSAIGQGEVLATPLAMASIAQTIANDGLRHPTSIVANRMLRPKTKPEQVMSKGLSNDITDLMVGVVTGGTGFAGAIPEAQVAGKTGTAELGPVPGQEDLPNPEQIKDAWFAAFAPAEKPRLAIAVMLINAEASGGEVAAPAASAVLSAGL